MFRGKWKADASSLLAKNCSTYIGARRDWRAGKKKRPQSARPAGTELTHCNWWCYLTLPQLSHQPHRYFYLSTCCTSTAYVQIYRKQTQNRRKLMDKLLVKHTHTHTHIHKQKQKFDRKTPVAICRLSLMGAAVWTTQFLCGIIYLLFSMRRVLCLKLSSCFCRRNWLTVCIQI